MTFFKIIILVKACQTSFSTSQYDSTLKSTKSFSISKRDTRQMRQRQVVTQEFDRARNKQFEHTYERMNEKIASKNFDFFHNFLRNVFTKILRDFFAMSKKKKNNYITLNFDIIKYQKREHRFLFFIYFHFFFLLFNLKNHYFIHLFFSYYRCKMLSH